MALPETLLKIELTKHLLRTDPEAILAMEVPYLFGERVADVVKIDGQEAVVYEIKSAKDSLNQLVEQINDYKKFFDQCYVVCEIKNLEAVRKLVPKQIGIIVYNGKKLEQKRKSALIRRLNKIALASVLTKKCLAKITKESQRKSHVDLTKIAASKLTLESLKKLSRDFLASKYKLSNSLMRAEISSEPTADDLYLLGKKIPERLLK